MEMRYAKAYTTDTSQVVHIKLTLAENLTIVDVIVAAVSTIKWKNINKLVAFSKVLITSQFHFRYLLKLREIILKIIKVWCKLVKEFLSKSPTFFPELNHQLKLMVRQIQTYQWYFM